ncbi:hypothetical protein AYO21_06941 [Fonsecaea monophora]|uniref:RNA helicase n=1 Tax=Fonsecaea monophora TaxID=254056 RepID=A0A177F5N6_9EURO|nr:hypothetical protein AYO21_06941 [Fonsecaea monophora]KAH0841169.1 ATP-dependent RNA helicase DRS1 [Fonsecaea pedrosoi]OAG38910.1 hypothetical protein AYO21_06941 [Fonsecaea monophora]
MTRAIDEDEFVLTISDNEELPASEPDTDDSDALEPRTSTKRKREEKNHTRKNKKQKVKGGVQDDDHNVPSDNPESDEETGVQDGALDPDFEFDIGMNHVQDLEEFDGWGEDNIITKEREQKKKGVDIDAIIARRAQKKTTSIASKKIKETSEELDEEQGSDEDDVEIPNFEDDELLAPDTFGADAQSEDEEVDEEEEEEEEEDGDSASDSDSVASPIAHPDDDLASDQSDAESQTSVSDDPDEKAKRAAFFAPENKHPDIKSASSFQQFSLSRPILRGLAALSFTTPTPIQVRAIPVALQGLDVVGSAVTGSGKTAAFLLPILERLLYRPRKVPTTRVAILMPTRELAVQCYSVATALARFTDITFAQVVGGFSLREQETILKKRPDVVIATPGRFIDHMRNSASFNVESIEILVLDEADRMLETGFEDELNEILRTIPKGRQTMLFSATMTDSVDKLVRVGMNRPIRLSVDAKKSTTAGLVQEFVRLRQGREGLRLATLCVLCQNFFTERTIVFFRQKKEAHRVRVVFGLLGLKAGELHGSMTQEQRISAVNAFRDGNTTHLLATDLASRGLDIKNVMTVINYEAPQTHEIYLHRVGRTARAGRSGCACTIAAEPDRKVVKAAVKSARQQGAKVVSRVMDIQEVDAMHQRLDDLDSEIEEILKEEKEQKQIAATEAEIKRGENLIKHESEIMARPKRTWFETEKEKRDAKNKGRMELNGPDGVGVVKVRTEKKRLSNKDKKRLDDARERKEGKMWRKGKGSEEAVKRMIKDKGKKNKKNGGKAKGRKR